jgi:Ca2+-binding EF-hand superfamily protein
MNHMLRYAVVVMTVLLPVIGNAEDRTVFNRMDADKGGDISREELLKADLGLVTTPNGQKQVVHRDLLKQGEAAAMTEEQKQRLFNQLDEDKNGYVTWKEWSRASPDGFVLFRF